MSRPADRPIALLIAALGGEGGGVGEVLTGGLAPAQDVVADVDVPAFDRSNYDGFAVLAASGPTECEQTHQSRPRPFAD